MPILSEDELHTNTNQSETQSAEHSDAPANPHSVTGDPERKRRPLAGASFYLRPREKGSRARVDALGPQKEPVHRTIKCYRLAEMVCGRFVATVAELDNADCKGPRCTYRRAITGESRQTPSRLQLRKVGAGSKPAGGPGSIPGLAVCGVHTGTIKSFGVDVGGVECVHANARGSGPHGEGGNQGRKPLRESRTSHSELKREAGVASGPTLLTQGRGPGCLRAFS